MRERSFGKINVDWTSVGRSEQKRFTSPDGENRAAKNLRSQLGESVWIGGICRGKFRDAKRIVGGTADNAESIRSGDPEPRTKVAGVVALQFKVDARGDDFATEKRPEVREPGSRAVAGEID